MHIMENSMTPEVVKSFVKDDEIVADLELFSPGFTMKELKRPISGQREFQMTSYRKRKFGKSLSFDAITDTTSPIKELLVETKRQRMSHSSSEIIINTLEKMSENECLIGDGTKVHELPTTNAGKHRDLKYISHVTLTELIENKYSDTIHDYVIIDCRYPYEYNGGHIKGSINLHTQEMIDGFIEASKKNNKTVLVFHCEFSSERAPKLLRYLRNKDRELNVENYPNLCYPEIYLLKGGYKEFFENQKNQCFPQNYVPMLNKNFSSDLRHFRSKSKSWNGFERRKYIRF